MLKILIQRSMNRKNEKNELTQIKQMHLFSIGKI